MLSSKTDLQATGGINPNFSRQHRRRIANPDRWKQILDPVFAGDLSQRPMA